MGHQRGFAAADPQPLQHPAPRFPTLSSDVAMLIMLTSLKILVETTAVFTELKKMQWKLSEEAVGSKSLLEMASSRRFSNGSRRGQDFSSRGAGSAWPQVLGRAL